MLFGPRLGLTLVNRWVEKVRLCFEIVLVLYLFIIRSFILLSAKRFENSSRSLKNAF
jgi:hypothetical protein